MYAGTFLFFKTKKMEDIQKIKELFNSSDTSNHKLAYSIAKNYLKMSDEKICEMLLLDGKNWIDVTNEYYSEGVDDIYGKFNYELYLFDGEIFLICSSGIWEGILFNGPDNDMKINKFKINSPISVFYEWFKQLNKE